MKKILLIIALVMMCSCSSGKDKKEVDGITLNDEPIVLGGD